MSDRANLAARSETLPIEVYVAVPEHQPSGSYGQPIGDPVPRGSWCVRWAITPAEGVEYDEMMDAAYLQALKQALADEEVVAMTKRAEKFEVVVAHKHGGRRWTIAVTEDV